MVIKLTLAAVLVGLSFGCGGGSDSDTPSSSAPRAAVTSPEVELRGTVTFRGTVPEPASIRVLGDPSCARVHPDAVVSPERVVVGDDGGLKNVFVYVKEGLEAQTFDIPEEAVFLDQQGCLYQPHVFGVRAGQTLTFMNSDDTLHNIHGTPKLNEEFNIGQPVKGMKTDKTLPIPEIMIPIRCDVHKWMASYLGVVGHPFFATTAIDGRYSIPDLPPGDYVIEAWHEKYGTQQLGVSVGKEAVDASFEFVE